jgi:hypothetical protein
VKAAFEKFLIFPYQITIRAFEILVAKQSIVYKIAIKKEKYSIKMVSLENPS